MAYTWTTIPLTELVSGKKVKAEHAQAFYNNVFALAEGATGAPRIATAALDLSFSASSTQAIGATSSWTVPNGIYVAVLEANMAVQLYDGTSWRGTTIATASQQKTIISDGTNTQIYNGDSISRNVYIRQVL